MWHWFPCLLIIHFPILAFNILKSDWGIKMMKNWIGWWGLSLSHDRRLVRRYLIMSRWVGIIASWVCGGLHSKGSCRLLYIRIMSGVIMRLNAYSCLCMVLSRIQVWRCRRGIRPWCIVWLCWRCGSWNGSWWSLGWCRLCRCWCWCNLGRNWCRYCSWSSNSWGWSDNRWCCYSRRRSCCLSRSRLCRLGWCWTRSSCYSCSICYLPRLSIRNSRSASSWRRRNILNTSMLNLDLLIYVHIIILRYRLRFFFLWLLLWLFFWLLLFLYLVFILFSFFTLFSFWRRNFFFRFFFLFIGRLLVCN